MDSWGGKRLPPGFDDLLRSVETLSEEEVATFLRKAMRFFEDLTDENYGKQTERILADAQSYLVYKAASYLRDDRANEAALCIFFIQLIAAIGQRGPDHWKNFFAQNPDASLDKICSGSDYLFHAETYSRSRSNIAEFVTESAKFYRTSYADASQEKIIRGMALDAKERMSQDAENADYAKAGTTPIWESDLHRLRDSIISSWTKERVGQLHIVNMRNSKNHSRAVHMDATLQWVMKEYAVHFDADPHKYTEVRHGCSKILLEISGMKSLEELGIQNYDVLVVEEDLPFEEMDVGSFQLSTPMEAQLKLMEWQIGSKRPTLQLFTFWRSLALHFPNEKDFGIEDFQLMTKEINASYIRAAEYLMRGNDIKAAFVIHYVSFMLEILESSPGYMSTFFSKNRLLSDDPLDYNDKKVGLFTKETFRHLGSSFHHTASRQSMMELLAGVGLARKEDRDTLENMLTVLERREMQDQQDLDYWADITKAFDYDSSYFLTITIHNHDSGYDDVSQMGSHATLGWLLKHHVIKCNVLETLQCPGIITPSTAYHRILYHGTTLFLSSSGRKSLRELGFYSGEQKIEVGGVRQQTVETPTKTPKPIPNSKNNKQKKGKGRGKKKKRQQAPAPVLSKEQLEKKYRKEHSSAMTPVFDEVYPLLKNIRTRLNNMALQKSSPKVKVPRAKSSENAAPREASLPLDDGIRGKAGKIAFPILVGETSNLYKTSKLKPSKTATVDLHGLSQNEALEKLNASLPMWIETAMKGEYPFVLPVDIICGGGSQTLAEVVREWIKSNRHVANRPTPK